jgi:hypothetical protein
MPARRWRVPEIMEDSLAYIAKRQIWDGEELVGFSASDRRQHVFIIGKTGSGKTTLLRNLILQDIEAGHAVGVIDPHGDLAHDLLDHIPPWRSDHLIYFNPADLENPVAFNLLANVPKDRRHLVTSGIIGAFKSIWRESWGPRMEYILANAISALLECQNVSLLGLQRMLSDDQYRRWVLRQVSDPVVRSFWVDEFDHYDDRFRKEAVAPIQNKVGQLLMGPIRNILGQVQSKIDFRFLMDNRRILIANLSKGLLGEDKANLLGSLLVTQFQQTAMRRADVPESLRQNCFLHVDEFHNFTSDSFASALSESRKYGLSLTLCTQFMQQTKLEIRDAIFGNVGNLLSFRVGESDAAILAREFGHAFAPEQFTDLANFNVLMRKIRSNEIAAPFHAITLPPSAVRYGRRDNLIRRSRERYTSPRAVVEDRIRRWMGSPERPK